MRYTCLLTAFRVAEARACSQGVCFEDAWECPSCHLQHPMGLLLRLEKLFGSSGAWCSTTLYCPESEDHQQDHGVRVGLLRRHLPGQLHSQPGRFHDPGGVCGPSDWPPVTRVRSLGTISAWGVNANGSPLRGCFPVSFRSQLRAGGQGH